MINYTDLVKRSGSIKILTRETTLKVINMVKAVIKALLEEYIMVIFILTKFTVKVFTNGKTVVTTKVNLLII